MTDAPPTELDIARAIRDGQLQSPTHLPGYSLFAMRITGTGASYRSAIEEFVWRDPSVYLNEEFLARCNGLPVVFDHPEKPMLNSEEFNERIVGMVVLPYINGQEVWGVARIYDADTLSILAHKVMSTSPGVKLGSGDENRRISLGRGDVLLIEGKPVSLDHLAICEAGVWDKLGEPSGILSTLTGDDAMTESEREAETKEREDKARKDAEKARMDASHKDNEAPPWAADAFKSIADSFGKMMERQDAAHTRMDAMEKRFDSVRKDAETTAEEKKAAEEREKADAARKDAEAKAEEERKDSEKKDAEHKARLDAVEEAVRKTAPVERSDADMAEMADAQARCDSVAMAFGKPARPPMSGESPIAYRRRLANEFKSHSPRWRDIDLATLPGGILSVAEEDIYKDAQVASRAPDSAAPLTLRAVRVPRPGGGFMTEYVGDPDAWMMSFKPPIRSRIMPGGLGLKNQHRD